MNNSRTFTGPRPVIAGGPCSGKTTVLAQLWEKSIVFGFTPIIVHEAATVILGAPFNPEVLKVPMSLQLAIFRYQKTQEEIADNYALSLIRQGKKPVIFHDRSLIDGKSYCTDDEWMDLLRYENITESEIHQRYTTAVFLDTAPKEFYTRDNNDRRGESYEEALQRGKKTKQVYVGFPSLTIVENREGGFPAKMYDTESASFRDIGYPELVEEELKFELTSDLFLNNLPVQFVHSVIAQDYLTLEDPEWIEQLRKRKFDDGVVLYTLTKKNRTTRVKKEQIINQEQYSYLLQRKNPERHTILKDRYCFLWENQYFKLDIFRSPQRRRPMLELRRTKDQQEIILPTMLGSWEDVTDKIRAFNENIARAS